MQIADIGEAQIKCKEKDLVKSLESKWMSNIVAESLVSGDEIGLVYSGRDSRTRRCKTRLFRGIILEIK